MKKIMMFGALALGVASVLTGCMSSSGTEPKAEAKQEIQPFKGEDRLRTFLYGLNIEDYLKICQSSLNSGKTECASLPTEREIVTCQAAKSLSCALGYDGNMYYDYIRLVSSEYTQRISTLAPYVEDRQAKLKAYNATAADVLRLDQAKIKDLTAKGEAQDVANHPDKLKAIIDEFSDLKSRYDSNITLLSYTYQAFEKEIMLFEYAKQALDSEKNKKYTASEKKLSAKFDKQIADLYTQLAALNKTLSNYSTDRALLENTVQYHQPSQE